MNYLVTFAVGFVLAIALFSPPATRHATPPDARTVAGTVHTNPEHLPASLSGDDGESYRLEFGDLPELRRVARSLNGKGAYVVGLYSEARHDVGGRAVTTRTLRVLYVTGDGKPDKE